MNTHFINTKLVKILAFTVSCTALVASVPPDTNFMNTKLVKLLAVSVSCTLVAGVPPPPGSRALQRGRRDDDDDDGWDWDDDFWDDETDFYDYYYGISVDDGDRCVEWDCSDDQECCHPHDECYYKNGKPDTCRDKCPNNPEFDCYVPPCAGRGDPCDDETACCAVWKSNIQPDFNVRVIERIAPDSSAALRELDESNRFIQKSAESTSI